MADVRASGWYPDLQIPSLLRWWDGQTWTGDLAPVGAPAASSTQMATRVRPSPARVPELLPVPASEPSRWSGDPGGKRDLDEEAAELFQAMAEPGVMERDDLRAELRDLTAQVPTLKQERDDLRTELGDLTAQVPTLKQERDDLLAAAVPLSAEVSDLFTKQEELIALRSEIQALRERKSWLEQSVAGIRRPGEKFKSRRTNSQRFHDS
jgi:NTP pyrophosphatase (non-canonical NTP hydrolase)